MEKYTLDIVNKTLTISAKFSEKMQNIDSEEFKLYERLLQTLPSLKIVRKTHKTPSQYTTKNGETFKCNQFKNLKYENMERFMSALPNKESYFAEYNFIKDYAALIQTNGYAAVRRWFIAQFPEFRQNPLFYLYHKPTVISGVNFLPQANSKDEADAMEEQLPKAG